MNPDLEAVIEKINRAELAQFTGIVVDGPHSRSPVSGETPLHIAVIWNDLESVGILLDAGAEIDVPGEEDFTPLHEAINQGYFDIVKFLVSKGADLHRNCRWGNATHLAGISESVEIKDFIQEKLKDRPGDLA